MTSRAYKSINEQLSLLQSRGLKINDSSYNFLLFKNYYNVINRYGQYFFDKSSQQFHHGTTFDNIVDLYFFDNDLKHLLYRKLMKVESHFKSVMSHIYSKGHDEEFSYLNPNSFHPDKKQEHTSLVVKLANQIHYNSGPRVPDNPIKHHMDKYGHVPFFVLVNHLYFNDAIRFYSIMKDSEKNEIAYIFYSKYLSEYNVTPLSSDAITSKQIDSFLRHLNDFRNLIAHDNFLFGSNIKTVPKYCDCVFRDYGIRKPQVDRTLYSCYIIMRVFLEQESYNNFHNRILKLVNKLKNKSSQQNVNIILEAMGFPKDWNLNTNKKR